MKTGLGLRRRLVNPLTQRIWGTITHVSTSRPIVALTFDDGPHPTFTPRLLAILERHQVRATFFMVGEAARRHPDLVRQVAAGGHTIGNHTWDHPSMPLISRRERRQQVRACAEALAPHGLRLFRPPYGNQSIASRLELAWYGYTAIGWSATARDSLTADADRMVERVKDRIRPGSIIVFHDALYDAIDERLFDRSPTLEAVDRLLRDFRGVQEFVSIPELLRVGRPEYTSFFGRPDLGLLNSLHASTGTPRRYPANAMPRVES